MSIVNCRVYGGLLLGLNQLPRLRRYWICAGLQSLGKTCTESGLYIIRRTGTGSVVD